MSKLFASLVIFRVNPVASPWNRMKPKRHVLAFPRWGSRCRALGRRTPARDPGALGWAGSTAPHADAHRPRQVCGGLYHVPPPTWVQKKPSAPHSNPRPRVEGKKAPSKGHLARAGPRKGTSATDTFLEQAAIRADFLFHSPSPKQE